MIPWTEMKDVKTMRSCDAKIFDSISKYIRSSFSAFLQTELSLLTYCNSILLSMPSEIKFKIQF